MSYKKITKQKRYDELIKYRDRKARERFLAKPYQTLDVTQYIAKKYGIKEVKRGHDKRAMEGDLSGDIQNPVRDEEDL